MATIRRFLGRRKPMQGASGGGGGAQTLLYPANLVYDGAFRVPDIRNADGNFDFGSGMIVYNPANDSLIYSGNTYNNAMCEFSCANPLVNSISNLNVATQLQAFKDVITGLPYDPLSADSNGASIGGMLINGSQLLFSYFLNYPGPTQVISHGILSSLTLASATKTGLYQVGTDSDNRKTAGAMCWIPSAWRSALGGSALVGLMEKSIVASNSSGPSAFAFDPSSVGGTPISAVKLLHYPVLHPLSPNYTGHANPMYSGASDRLVSGMAFIDSTDTVLYFGAATGAYNTYSTPGAANDSTGGTHGGTGPHALNGEYCPQFTAYDANDLLAVKNGTKQSYEPRPYAIWNPVFPFMNPGCECGGMAWDATNSRLYVLMNQEDTLQAFKYLPVIHRFTINRNLSQTVPWIGTLGATPIDGGGAWDATYNPITSGKNVRLTAGNVFAPPGRTITQVEFFKNGVSIGLGTKNLTETDAYNNWIKTHTTSGSGSQTMTAVATDSNGSTSAAKSYTMVVA